MNTTVDPHAAPKAAPNTSQHLSANDPRTLGIKPIGKLLWQYSVPAVIAQLAVSLYNIVDSVFIGRGVGAMALSGLAVAFPLMNLFAAFCFLVAIGAATISSISLGQKDPLKAQRTLNAAVGTSVVFAVVTGIAGLVWLDPMLRLFGATDKTLPYAAEFMRTIIYGMPILFVFLALNYVMRATGYPRKAMWSAMFSVVVNVALCPLFIYVFHWGIAGAAWASVGGYTAACVWCLWHFFDKKSNVHFVRGVGWWFPKIVGRMCAIGMAPFLMNVAGCIVVMFLNRALLKYGGVEGNLCIGAYGILNRTTMVFVSIVYGLTEGMQPILGYNYGAGRWDRVMKTLKRGFWIGVAISGVGWALTEGIPDTISGMFTTDKEMIDIARRGFRIYFIFYPVVGAQVVIGNFFQYIGKPSLSILLSLTRQLIFLLPFLFLLPPHWGVDGVWASMCGSDWCAFAVAMISLWWFLRHHKKEMELHARLTPTAN